MGQLQQVEPLLFWNVSNFFTFILGRLILITPEGQYWERGILPTLKLDETGRSGCQGHSIWTICIPLNHFCSGNFPTFSLSYWEPNSYYPRGPILTDCNRIQMTLPQLGSGAPRSGRCCSCRASPAAASSPSSSSSSSPRRSRPAQDTQWKSLSAVCNTFCRD